MENQFAEKMAGLTDAALLVIVNERRGDYGPDAILAAEKELSGRNLSPELLERAVRENELVKETILDKANEPLAPFWRGLAFMFPGVLALMFSGTFKADGYDRKSKELFRATLYGIGFYVILIVVISIFN